MERKTASELAAIIMERLREVYPECDDYISGVVVSSASGPAGKWIAETTPLPGKIVPSDCYRFLSAIVQKLRKQYDFAR
jgi:hypothetical protein